MVLRQRRGRVSKVNTWPCAEGDVASMEASAMRTRDCLTEIRMHFASAKSIISLTTTWSLSAIGIALCPRRLLRSTCVGEVRRLGDRHTGSLSSVP